MKRGHSALSPGGRALLRPGTKSRMSPFFALLLLVGPAAGAENEPSNNFVTELVNTWIEPPGPGHDAAHPAAGFSFDAVFVPDPVLSGFQVRGGLSSVMGAAKIRARRRSSPIPPAS